MNYFKNYVYFFALIFSLSFFIQFFPQTSFASSFYYPSKVQNSFKKLQQLNAAKLEQNFNILSLLPSNELSLLKEQFTKHLASIFLVSKHAVCTKNNPSCLLNSQKKYKQARKYIFGLLHLKGKSKKEYYINDIYCSRSFTNKDFPKNKNLGPNKIPLHTVLNTEHIWPQSRFSSHYPTVTQLTDLHILYPSDSKTNSQRGNNLFGEVSKVRSISCGTSKIGFSKNSSEVNFEPPNNYKGNVARAMFYFSLRYKLPISLKKQKMFKRWAMLDPVDEFEINRNEAIFKINKTRNPFIDQPESILYISDSWGK
ncbi:MAG: hypothetical protein HAW60_05215 [Bdellovibrionales bacterium]|nr:hypothetical protein [Bdellovibrionales bacterium]